MVEQSSKEGQLRVWNIVNLPSEPAYFEVKDLSQAQDLIEKLADLQLGDPDITSNVFGLEVFRNGEWEEWESCDGLDINEFMGEQDVNKDMEDEGFGDDVEAQNQVIQDLENRLSEVFDSITNGLISKPYTEVKTVLQEAQNVYQVDLQKEINRKLDNQRRYIDQLRNKVREINRSAEEFRYKLAFYAEPANYEFDEVTQGSSAIERDKGKIAREALGIEEPDPNKVIRDALEYLAKMKHSSPAGHLAKDALNALDKLSDDR